MGFLQDSTGVSPCWGGRWLIKHQLSVCPYKTEPGARNELAGGVIAGFTAPPNTPKTWAKLSKPYQELRGCCKPVLASQSHPQNPLAVLMSKVPQEKWQHQPPKSQPKGNWGQQQGRCQGCFDIFEMAFKQGFTAQTTTLPASPASTFHLNHSLLIPTRNSRDENLKRFIL